MIKISRNQIFRTLFAILVILTSVFCLNLLHVISFPIRKVDSDSALVQYLDSHDFTTEEKNQIEQLQLNALGITREGFTSYVHQLPRLRSIQRESEEEVLSLPGVVSIGIGERNKTPVFIVMKESEESDYLIPKKLGNTEVVIVRSKPLSLLDSGPSCNNGNGPPCHANQTEQPVQMGNSGRWFQQSDGCTMGFQACDLDTKRFVFVTNSHCAQFTNGCNLAPLGDSVRHAANGDAPIGQNFSVGRISGHVAPQCGSKGNFVDATKVDTNRFIETSPIIRDIGYPNFWFPFPVETYPTPVLQYSGRTSGRNFGRLVGINASINVPSPDAGGFCCGPLIMKDQSIMETSSPAMGGDSGSAVLLFDWVNQAYDRKLVGLLWAGGGKYGYYNDIGRVFSSLNLTDNPFPCLESEQVAFER